MAMFSSLPEEVVIEILSRLPVNLLLRLKCVCKSWCALIGKLDFLAKQLLKRSYSPSSNPDDNCCVLLRRLVYRGAGKIETVLSLVTYDHKVQAEEDVSVVDFQPNCKEITSSCDCIICLCSSCKDEVAIANPEIGEVKVLPGSCSQIPPPDDKDSFLSNAGAVFGYDPKTKINRYGPVVPPPRVEIYTLGTDSWREIDCVSPSALWSYRQIEAMYI